MHRDADGAGLIRDGAGDGLADPPGGVGRELVSFGIVEFFDGLDQAQVALLNQVEELHAAADIALGDGNDQAQVALGELFAGFLVAGCHALGDFQFFLGGEQRHLADLLEVHAHGVVGGDAFGDGKILRLGGKLLRLGLLHRKLLLRGLLCLARHIYAHFLEAVQYVFIRFGRNLQIGQCFLDFFLCQRAVFLSLLDQRGNARLLVVNGGHRGHSFRSNRSPPRVSPARARDLQKPLYPKAAEILAALFSFFGGFTHPPCFSRSLLSSSLV